MPQLRILVVLLVTFGAASCDRAETPAAATAPTPDPGPGGGASQGCAQTSVGFTPLSDLGFGTYQGESGGLYGRGQNSMPASHLDAGLALARAIGPLDSFGRPDASGRFAFISIGMSNTTQEFSTFLPIASSDPQKHPRLVLVDGAQGGVTAADWMNPGCPCWSVLNERLQRAGITPAQVATAWIKLADRQPTSPWPVYARTLASETSAVLRLLKARFPNLQLAYLSSRIYAGYATSTLNPEPYAYESAFGVRWTIDEQLAGGLSFRSPGAESPWIAWGPYLWADGLRPRSDGLTWSCGELQADGTHPSPSGRQKVAQALLDFMHTDPTAREWYLQ